MNKKRISEIFSDDRFSLYAVESIDVMCNKGATGFTWHGNVTPTAIIIHDPEKNLALDMDAKSLQLETLKQSIPELNMIKGL